MHARREDAKRRWGWVSSPAVISSAAEREPAPWAVVLERLHAAAATGELAQSPETAQRRSLIGRNRHAAEVRRRLLEAIAHRARTGNLP